MRKVEPPFPLPEPVRECHSTPGDRPCEGCHKADRLTRTEIAMGLLVAILVDFAFVYQLATTR